MLLVSSSPPSLSVNNARISFSETPSFFSVCPANPLLLSASTGGSICNPLTWQKIIGTFALSFRNCFFSAPSCVQTMNRSRLSSLHASSMLSLTFSMYPLLLLFFFVFFFIVASSLPPPPPPPPEGFSFSFTSNSLCV